MYAAVTHVGKIEQPVVGELVLKVEGPVLGVRQLVANVITTEQEGAKQVARREVIRIRFVTGWANRRENWQRVAAGGAGAVVPKGVEREAPRAAATGSTKGGASVTPNGPLKPEPALGDK